MTFGRFHFRVGKEGSHRLVVPISSGPLAADSDSSGSSSSFESGDEEVSPSSFIKPATSGKLADMFGGSSADSDLSSDTESVDNFDFIDRSTSIREVFADLYDGVTDPEEENKATIYHQRCEETNLVLNWEKCHFMVNEGIVLGHKISERGIEVDRAKVEAIEKMPYPRDVKAGCECLSFLDAYSGYNQIRLKEEDEVKTAFIIPYGVFCYRTMPFGLKNAGATYQRMMQKCLATQIGKNVQVYIDDVVITTNQGSS
ncbi:hypothetical protein QYE76_059451 [Lolium multiflorum]|uniref:Reverse transcriptase domain-containing protein n=1 Tax=Lolium multiflorum TaxID=4521 RepID=A0AAD8RX12_LOLMU|nr:hypothetical protein QYE76_059451 [Lolium multiflorum]